MHIPRKLIKSDRRKIIDILDKFQFFQGQRAGRELWLNKPIEVQEEDLENFNKDIRTIRDYICDLETSVKKYKDLEEQGLILKLPCKVGKTVWCLENDDYAGYVFIAIVGEYYFVAPHYEHCDDISEQLEEMENDTENGFEPNVSVFHKSKVFLTKEKAEAKLKELQEKQ